MIECPRSDLRDLLPDWMHGTLGAGARAAVEAHLAGCAGCRDEVEMLRQVREALAASAPQVDAEGIAASVQRASRRGSLRARWKPLRRPAWRAGLGLAALAASLIGVAVVTRRDVATGGDALGRSGPPSSGVGRGRVGELEGRTSGGEGSPTVLHGSRPGERRVASEGEHPELLLGGGVGDLGDMDLKLLLDSLDRVDALPVPTPDPVVATLGAEGS